MFLIIIVLLKFASALQASFSVVPNTVGSVSNFEFEIIFDQSLGYGGIIMVNILDKAQSNQLPTNKGLQFLLNSVQNSNNQVSCIRLSNLENGPELLNCQLISSTTLKIVLNTNTFVLAGQTFKVRVVGSTRNPSSLLYGDQSLGVTTFTSDSKTQVESQNQFITIASLVPAQINVSSIQLGSPILGQLGSSMALSFQVQSLIPGTGSIEIQFPQRFVSSQQTMWYLKDVASAIQINGLDSKSLITQNLTTGVSGTFQALTLKSISSQFQVQAGSTYSLIFSSFDNPLSYINASYGVVVRTFDNFYQQMDQSTIIPLFGNQPASIGSNNFQVSIDNHSTIINQQSSITLGFNIPLPLIQGCVIQVTIPQGFSYDLFNSLRFVYAYGMFGRTQSLPFQMINNSNNLSQIIQITNACSFDGIVNNQMAYLQFKYLKNPDSVRNSGDFGLRIFDSNNNMLVTTSQLSIINSNILSTSFQPANLSFFQIIPSNQTAGERNDLLFQIQLTNTLMQQRLPSFIIQIPNNMTLENNTCIFQGLSTGLSNLLSDNITCQVNQVSSQVNITGSILQTNLSSTSGVLAFRISQFMRNPPVMFDQIGSFKIMTAMNGNIVDQQTVQNPFKVSAGQLYGTFLNFIPNVNSKINPTVQLNFTPQHTLISGSIITLRFPLTDFSLLQNQILNCSGPQIIQSSCQASLTNTEIQFTASIQGTITRFTQVSLTASNLLQNSQRYSGAFAQKMYISTSISGQVIDENSQVTTIISQAQNISDCQIQLSSQQNSDYSGLNIQFTVPTELQIMSSDVIQVQVPSLFNDPQVIRDKAQVQCTRNGLVCQFISSNNSFSPSYFLVSGIQSQTKSFQFQISGFYNPSSTRPMNPFQILIIDGNQNRLAQCSNQSITLYTSIAQPVSYVNLVQTSSNPGIPVNYTLTVQKTLNSANLLPWVKLTIPDCCNLLGQNIQIIDQNSNQFLNLIRKYSQFDYVFQMPGNSINGISLLSILQIVGLQNPIESCLTQSQRTSFLFRLFEDDQLAYQIDEQLQGLDPSISCQFPCNQCKSTNRQFCRSCQNSLNYILLSDIGQCQDRKKIVNSPTSLACPVNYYLFGDASQSKTPSLQTTCNKCVDNCQTCNDFTGICTLCNSGFLLNTSSNICITNSQCSIQSQNSPISNIIIDNNFCTQCHPSCQTCGNNSQTPLIMSLSTTYSPQYCTKCRLPSQVLLDGQCLSQCPSGYQNATNRINGQVYCFIPNAQNQNSAEEMQQTIDSYSDVIIAQKNSLTVLAHFPILFIILPLLLIFTKCQESGRSSLSIKEIIILSFQVCEYISLWVIMLKSSIAIGRMSAMSSDFIQFDQNQKNSSIAYITSSNSQTLLQNQINNVIFGFLSIALINISAQHLINEWFFRQFLNLWENNVIEDFHDEFVSIRRSRCGFDRAFLMRFINFHEWISLWKARGWIIPQDQELLLANITWNYQQTAKYTSTLMVIVRFLPFTFSTIVLYFKFIYPQKFLYKDENNIPSLAGSQEEQTLALVHQNYAQYALFIRDYVVNAALEILIIGLIAQTFSIAYLLNGEPQKIQEVWDQHRKVDIEEVKEVQEVYQVMENLETNLQNPSAYSIIDVKYMNNQGKILVFSQNTENNSKEKNSAGEKSFDSSIHHTQNNYSQNQQQIDNKLQSQAISQITKEKLSQKSFTSFQYLDQVQKQKSNAQKQIDIKEEKEELQFDDDEIRNSNKSHYIKDEQTKQKFLRSESRMNKATQLEEKVENQKKKFKTTFDSSRRESLEQSLADSQRPLTNLDESLDVNFEIGKQGEKSLKKKQSEEPQQTSRFATQNNPEDVKKNISSSNASSNKTMVKNVSDRRITKEMFKSPMQQIAFSESSESSLDFELAKASLKNATPIRHQI